MKATSLLFIFFLMVLGCARTTVDFNRLQIGMYEQQVLSLLGESKYKAAKGNVVMYHFNFRGKEWTPERGMFNNPLVDYYVRLVNGRVESYGKLGDFDSTKDTTLNLNIKNR
jgi:hypothetical protein